MGPVGNREWWTAVRHAWSTLALGAATVCSGSLRYHRPANWRFAHQWEKGYGGGVDTHGLGPGPTVAAFSALL